MKPVLYVACRGNELEFQLAQAVAELERKMVHDELEFRLNKENAKPVAFTLSDRGWESTARR